STQVRGLSLELVHPSNRGGGSGPVTPGSWSSAFRRLAGCGCGEAGRRPPAKAGTPEMRPRHPSDQIKTVAAGTWFASQALEQGLSRRFHQSRRIDDRQEYVTNDCDEAGTISEVAQRDGGPRSERRPGR